MIEVKSIYCVNILGHEFMMLLIRIYKHLLYYVSMIIKKQTKFKLIPLIYER